MVMFQWNKFRYLTYASLFSAELLLHNYKQLRPLLRYGEYIYDCKLKKIREMSLTTLAHNHHDVIDIIWILYVWNVNIRRYVASCTLQFWSNLTKISFQGKHFNHFWILLYIWHVGFHIFKMVDLRLLAEPLSINCS